MLASCSPSLTEHGVQRRRARAWIDGVSDGVRCRWGLPHPLDASEIRTNPSSRTLLKPPPSAVASSPGPWRLPGPVPCPHHGRAALSPCLIGEAQGPQGSVVWECLPVGQGAESGVLVLIRGLGDAADDGGLQVPASTSKPGVRLRKRGYGYCDSVM